MAVVVGIYIDCDQRGRATLVIATAAFGSPLAAQLDLFREFRDRVLLRNPLGRAFVAWYYDGFGPAGAT